MIIKRWNMTFGHVMSVFSSHDTDGIINSTATLLVEDDWMQCNMASSVI